MGDAVTFEVLRLEVVTNAAGGIIKILSPSDIQAKPVAEAYLSSVNPACSKGWILHQQATSRLLVVMGTVRFRFRSDSSASEEEAIVSASDAELVIIQAGTWFGFECVSTEVAVILSLPDMPHDPSEQLRQPLPLLER